ncbi:amidohydrolase family protein [Haloarcula onubensis]|uniref:Amidohydrolase family protein n=1 Tax=Haloarcula onubensis TaxID=2950539 RepID=A0ABU2FMF0_9EURY|nr:amidohydrolase family protein [Halomicroarcula sp. S3CR25-11]MDS0281918.1 amidohydrolase family protein [Halomicroarcula sp. S3CR25-11]
MLENGELVVDAVSHCFNHADDNHLHPHSQRWDDETYELGEQLMPEEYMFPEEIFYRNHQPEELERLLFLESQIDYSVYHSLPLDDYFKDGYVSREKGFELRERNPNRMGMIVDINPLEDDAVEQVEYYAKKKDVDGIKLYPARYQNGRDLALQLNEDTVRPVLEKAADLDVGTVGIHKFIPFATAPVKYFRIDDVEEAALAFPELNFEVIHAGFSFLEETVFAMASHDNVYANIENTAHMACSRPEKFARSLGEMLYWAGPDRIVFSSGATALHPQPPIDAIWDFEMPEDLRAGEDYPEVTQEDKEKILGKNKLRLMGKDPEQVKKDIKGDKWDQKIQELKEQGEYPAPPWSTYEEPTEDASKERVKYV